MSDQTRRPGPVPLPLPDNPNLDWFRKQAKRRLAALREATADAQLADAQFELAKQRGSTSWRALKTHVDSLTSDGQVVDAARSGDVNTLTVLLDKIQTDCTSDRSRTSGRCFTTPRAGGTWPPWISC